MKKKYFFLIATAAFIGIVIYSGYLGYKNYLNSKIIDFDSCAKAGHPIQEMYPARCIGPNGKAYIQKVENEEGAICTMDSVLCPDGSYVERTGPDCEFVCPKD